MAVAVDSITVEGCFYNSSLYSIVSTWVQAIYKVGYHNKETGELLDKSIVKSIEREDEMNYRIFLFKKFECDPISLSLDEIKKIRMWKSKSNKSRFHLRLEKGTFFMTGKLNEEQENIISLDTLGVLYKVSNRMNKYGIINYKNNKPVPSFNKLKEYLNIGNSKWTRIKQEVDDLNIISKMTTRDDKSILIINPLYALTSTEVGEVRFIAYGDIFKSILPLEDYIYLCKLYDIVPEFS